MPAVCRSDQVRTGSNTCACPPGQEEFDDGCAVPVSCRDDQERTSTNACGCPFGQAEHLPGVCSCGLDILPPVPGTPMIDSISTAFDRYFEGDGTGVYLGTASQIAVMGTSRQLEAVRNLRSGSSLDWNTPYPDDPPLVTNPGKDCFGKVGCYRAETGNLWIGATEIHYVTKCDGACCKTNFDGAVNDGFWDMAPLHINYLLDLLNCGLQAGQGALEPYCPLIEEYLGQGLTCTYDQAGPCGEVLDGKPYPFIPFTWSIKYPDPRLPEG